MITNKDHLALPLRALDQIPTPNADAKSITGLIKESGKVTGYQLSDNTFVNKQEGVELAKGGGIKGVGVANRKGVEYLKTLPDDSENNNLSNLPAVSKQ